MDDWSAIIENYKKARHCFWCPKHHSDGWMRDDENGYYYLMLAYHEAKAMQEKQPLWYSRILYMMADELRYKFPDYVILHKFIGPAVEQFRACHSGTGVPSEKEMEYAQFMYDQLSYKAEWTSYDKHSYEEMLSFIEDSDELGEFEFHDSRIVGFTNDGQDAELTLRYGEIAATFHFYGVDQIEAAYDPITSWVYDFWCYPTARGYKYKCFDIEMIKIFCDSIKVVSVNQNVRREITCPVCGKKNLDEYETCKVCGWINDPYQVSHPDSESGSNRVSLNKAKEIYRQSGRIR